MVEGRDGSRAITDSPFMKEYRWKNHDVFPHSNYVERIRNLGYDESILGSQTCNQLVVSNALLAHLKDSGWLMLLAVLGRAVTQG